MLMCTSLFANQQAVPLPRMLHEWTHMQSSSTRSQDYPFTVVDARHLGISATHSLVSNINTTQCTSPSLAHRKGHWAPRSILQKTVLLTWVPRKKINIKPTQCSEMSTYCLMDLWNTTQCLELPLQLQKCKVFFCVISKHQLGAGICIYFTSPSLLLYVCLLYLLCCMSLFLSSNFLLRTALTEKK